MPRDATGVTIDDATGVTGSVALQNWMWRDLAVRQWNAMVVRGLVLGNILYGPGF